MSDYDVVREGLDMLEDAGELHAALDRIQAENERLLLRDKMRDDVAPHLLGEVEARDKEIERLREALEEIRALTSIENTALLRAKIIATAALGEQP